MIAFANSSANVWTGTLSIFNWSGNAGVGGGTDQVLCGIDTTGLTPGQIAQIEVFTDGGTTSFGLGNNLILSNGEVVPIPEPTTWSMVLLGAAMLTS